MEETGAPHACSCHVGLVLTVPNRWGGIPAFYFALNERPGGVRRLRTAELGRMGYFSQFENQKLMRQNARQRKTLISSTFAREGCYRGQEGDA